MDGATSTTAMNAGSTRYMSPEVLQGESKSFESDVYAFGITIFEVRFLAILAMCPFDFVSLQVLTATLPFGSLAGSVAVMRAILEGERPSPLEPRSRGNEDFVRLWKIATRCWQTEPGRRPLGSEIYEWLR